MKLIIEDIIRPTLLVDREKCMQNIIRMQNKAEKSGSIFRPHFKTHQSATVGEWFKACGIKAITVSSAGMAEYFAAKGWNDITVAFPLNIKEIYTLMELSSRINLQVLVSNMITMQQLVSLVRSPLGYFVEVDNGYARSGVAMSDIALISRLLEMAGKNSNLRFRGFLSHFGNTYDATSPGQITSIFNQGKNDMVSLKEQFLPIYPELIISAGDTPGCSLAGNFSGLDEIRLGNFVYYDLVQFQFGSCRAEQIAAVVACPVVEVHEDRSQLIIYGGAVHFSKD